MTSTTVRTAKPIRTPARPTTTAITAAVLVVTCCVTFAAANVILETTGGLFDGGGRYASLAGTYPAGLAIANGLVFTLKLIAALVAILTVTRLPRIVRPPLVGIAVWTAFTTLAVYSLGNVTEAIAIWTGRTGDPGMINPKTVAYVLFFLIFAAAFGTLAISFTRRYALRRRYIVLGALGAPVILGGVLFALQPLLAALGLLPAA